MNFRRKIFIAPKDSSLNFRGSVFSYFSIVLISAVMSILDDFGSLLPARTVTVKTFSSPSKPLSVILKSQALLCQRLYREHVLELLELMLRYLSCLSLNNLKFSSSLLTTRFILDGWTSKDFTPPTLYWYYQFDNTIFQPFKLKLIYWNLVLKTYWVILALMHSWFEY